MKAFWVFIILIGISLVGVNGSRPANQTEVTDVSWPNCTIQLPRAGSGIVGVTGGLALRPNPCLAHEAGLFKKPSIYINTGYPGPNIAHKLQLSPKPCGQIDKTCMAYNYGYNNGLYAIKYALLSGVIANNWWLDVETENSWDDNTQVNRASLQGNLDAVANLVGRDHVGFYSYPGQWDLITGKWRNGYSAWVATGSTKAIDAVMACDLPSFTGGPVLLGQYTPNLDQNIICN